MKTVVAGTFDILHKGHEKLLKKAIKVANGDMIYVGLTSDEFAKKMKKRKVNKFEDRKRELKKFFKKEKAKARIIKINDIFAFSTKFKGLEAIVVSEETYENAKKINEERKKKGLKKLRIYKVKIVKSEDGKKISSERIRKGIIDRNGRVIKSKGKSN